MSIGLLIIIVLVAVILLAMVVVSIATVVYVVRARSRKEFEASPVEDPPVVKKRMLEPLDPNKKPISRVKPPEPWKPPEPPPRPPIDPPQVRLEKLRAFFSDIKVPTERDWAVLCRLFDRWLDAEDLEVEVDYAQDHLETWSDALRVAPLPWALGQETGVSRYDLFDGVRGMRIPPSPQIPLPNVNLRVTKLSNPPPPPWRLVRTIDLHALSLYDRDWALGGYYSENNPPRICFGGVHADLLVELVEWPHSGQLTRVIFPSGRDADFGRYLFGMPEYEHIEFVVMDPTPEEEFMVWEEHHAPKPLTVD